MFRLILLLQIFSQICIPLGDFKIVRLFLSTVHINRLKPKVSPRLLLQLAPTGRVTLPMLRLLSSKAQECKDYRKLSKPCLVGIHQKVLTDYSQMSTHVPGFQSFFSFFAFCIGQISHYISSIRVKIPQPAWNDIRT